MNKETFKLSIVATMSSVGGAVISTFVSRWINNFTPIISVILILVYTLVVFGAFAYFFSSFK